MSWMNKLIIIIIIIIITDYIYVWRQFFFCSLIFLAIIGLEVYLTHTNYIHYLLIGILQLIFKKKKSFWIQKILKWGGGWLLSWLVGWWCFSAKIQKMLIIYSFGLKYFCWSSLVWNTIFSWEKQMPFDLSKWMCVSTFIFKWPVKHRSISVLLSKKCLN